MGKLRVLSGKQVCAILARHGFLAVRQRGSHVVMQKGLAKLLELFNGDRSNQVLPIQCIAYLLQAFQLVMADETFQHVIDIGDGLGQPPQDILVVQP